MSIFRPTMYFILSVILGTIISLNISNEKVFYIFPEINITYQYMLDKFKFIFTNNLIILLSCFFSIRFLIYLKIHLFKNPKITKIEYFFYHLINSVILIKTGVSLGYTITEIDLQTNKTFIELYLNGIIPHGILEISAFIICFHINNRFIKNIDFNKNPFSFNKTTLATLCIMILIAALIESTITPLLLYT